MVRGMTELDPDVQPGGDAFEAAYNLPADFPENMKALHTEILTKLRNEARAIPMSTTMYMLIERMTHFYVAMKVRESQSDTPFSLKEQKEMLDFWLKMLVEFNKNVAAASDRAKSSLLLEVQNVLKSSLKLVRKKDPELAKELGLTWSEDFARMDI